MKSPRHPNSSNRIVIDNGAWRPSWGYLLVAVSLLAGGLGYWWMSDTAPAESSQTAAASAAAAQNNTTGAWPIQANVPVASNTPNATREAHVDTDATQDPTPDLSSYVPRGENPTMNQVIERLHQAGIYTGLGAFNPPGTRPPKVGLAVPEGYPLPDGYVRHYQATDDGQRIEPILMFAPDREIRDASGHAINVPEDHVVTPELAPPGFPIRRITIPAPLQPGRSGT